MKFYKLTSTFFIHNFKNIIEHANYLWYNCHYNLINSVEDSGIFNRPLLDEPLERLRWAPKGKAKIIGETLR